MMSGPPITPDTYRERQTLPQEQQQPPQQQEQEPPLTTQEVELIRLDSAIANEIVQGAGTLIQYALENISKLVVDDKGNVVRPDALQLMKLLASRRAVRMGGGRMYIPPPTEDEFFDVLEHLAAIGHLRYQDLDSGIRNLPSVLRYLINAGLGAAREAVSSKPDVLRWLEREREDLMLKLMYQNKETRKAYDILVVRPHLLKFLSDYALLNLGVKLSPTVPSRNRMMSARVLDFRTNPPRVLVGGKEERVLPSNPGTFSGQGQQQQPQRRFR